MSEKTVVPGMESPYQGPSQNFSAPGASPYGTPAEDSSSTRVPGMDRFASTASKAASSKPIVGFLYSISRVPTGEFWPVYQGSNLLGRDAECDVILPEASISRRHATLVVRKNKNPEKMVAAVTDLGSTDGTMINGTSLNFTAQEIFNGDKIQVGQNYELVFLLIDPKEQGLKVAEDFVAVDTPASHAPTFSAPDFRGTAGAGFPPSFNGPDSYNAGPRVSDGTVSFDGRSMSGPGGTQIN